MMKINKMSCYSVKFQVSELNSESNNNRQKNLVPKQITFQKLKHHYKLREMSLTKSNKKYPLN